MSGGLNKEFRRAMGGEFGGPRNPAAYMANHLLVTQPDYSLIALPSGVHVFNLVQHGNFISPRIAPAPLPNGSRAFNAYFCPNIQNAVGTVILGGAANYMFTPALTGCIFEINGTTVNHHDGELIPWPPPGLAGVAWGGPGVAGHRKWNNDAAAPPGGLGFYTSIVIGVRFGGVWEFWQQSYNIGAAAPIPAAQVSTV